MKDIVTGVLIDTSYEGTIPKDVIVIDIPITRLSYNTAALPNGAGWKAVTTMHDQGIPAFEAILISSNLLKTAEGLLFTDQADEVKLGFVKGDNAD